LKPANFIWAGDNLKIIDFGIASKLQQDHTSIAVANTKGTINFMSPESISGDTSGRAKVTYMKQF
jgi:serine/threonine-protein kinase TTK/MPS1